MIGVVIIGHGHLAQEFLAALTHVLGKQTQIAAINVGAQDDLSTKRTELLSAIKAVSTGDGVVIATDLFGGSPSNIAISVMEETGAEVIAGVNLPLLLKLAELRSTHNMADALATAREAGQKYIKIASALVK
jgi:mannose PTS system EIIA component